MADIARLTPETLTLTDGKITGCTAEGADETEGVGSKAIEQLPGEIARERQHCSGRRVHRNHHLQRHQGGSRCCYHRCWSEA